jgi:sodium transport system permease protein
VTIDLTAIGGSCGNDVGMRMGNNADGEQDRQSDQRRAVGHGVERLMMDLAETRTRGGRIDWRQVGILYGRELRAALRERNIVINSLLIPLLLYPFLLWVAFTGITFVQGQTEGFRSRVLVPQWPVGHRELQRAFGRDESIQLIETTAAVASDPEGGLAEGTLDALVEFIAVEGTAAGLPGNFQVRITFNESKERSGMARDRVRRILDRYRGEWLEREADALGLDRSDWELFTITTENVATARELGAFVLGLMLPMFFVVAVALGCFYPAVDATAGERERGTWETLMSTGANRLSIATAKYLLVASLGCAAGLLNLAALALTMKPILSPLLERSGETLAFTVSLPAVPVIVLGGILLAGFVAAGMLLFAVFARTFKEGQSMITPFFMVIVLPVLFLQTPGLEFSPGLACVPVVNVVLMIRAALAGSFPWLPIVLTGLVSMLLVVLCVRLGALILEREDVLLGSHSGFGSFFRQLGLGRAAADRRLR